MAPSWQARALVLAALLFPVAGCLGATVRRAEAPTREYPAGVTSLKWRTPVHVHGLFEPRPEECASGVVVNQRLIVGSRAGTVVALDVGDGKTLWSTPVSGGVDAEARFDAAHQQVYVGTDDGLVYALSPSDGHIRWSYRGKGAVERPPELGGDAVYVTGDACATAADCQRGFECGGSACTDGNHGNPCSTDSDCRTGACRSATCVDGRDSDYCEADQDCDSGICVYGIRCSAGELDAMCEFDSDCLSGICAGNNSDSACTDGATGSKCIDDADCASGACTYDATLRPGSHFGACD
jgi:outer membrane protein assembly factor BamB